MERPRSDEQATSQQPALEVLQGIGYTYLSAEEAEHMRGNHYNVLLTDVLGPQLNQLNDYEYRGDIHSFSASNIQKAIEDLDEPLAEGMTKANERIYESLMLGRSYTEHLPDGGKQSFTIQYIDWDDIKNNAFHVVEEFVVERQDGEDTVRPDLVLFVNGIPFGVIECKRASVSMNQGISQMIRNQGKDFAPHLFRYVQLVAAANKNEVKYATAGTPEKFWSVWKEEETEWVNEEMSHIINGRLPTTQDRNLVSLFHPERLFNFTQFFVIYENNIKKIARYQQFFAIQEILRTVEERDEKGNRQSGVIWHTQGSGKSLTMVMLAKYILTEMRSANPKVVVVTDRIELDKQIRDTFNHSRLKANRAMSGKHLVDLIHDDGADVITTLVHKFDTATQKQQPVEDQDIFVLVDESHRSQYGEMHMKMKKVFPNACYLGFTGTPLMKKEKNTMVKFGKLIHQYTIADGVKDKAILPLLYEGRMVEQTVNQNAIDHRLDVITRHLNDEQKDEVMKKWSKFERIASSDQRIQRIAFDIDNHFLNNYKIQGSAFKAMLATNSKTEAIHYLEAFEELGDLNCAVVMSSPDTREGYSEVDAVSKDKVQQFWQCMMNKYGDENRYEDAIKDEFVNGDDIDLLIVVDKLLTGFDAPKASVFYIDKPLKEHTLLQAIARVNRLYEGKDYGMIIDYRGLLEKLDRAMEMYSGAGLENFDPKDLKGAIYDIVSVVGTIRQHHSDIWQLFSSVKNRKDMEEYEVLLEEEDARNSFYQSLSQFARHVGIALESEEIYEALGEEKIQQYKADLKFFQELRKSVKLRYSDSIDHKEYEAKMQKLMDQYIASEGIMQITPPVDILDRDKFEEEMERLGSKRAKADAIRTRLTKSINEKYEENPAYYEKFSERIRKTLEDYKEKRISEAEYWQRMNEMKEEYRQGASEDQYPERIHGNRNAQAFYGVAQSIIEEVKEAEAPYGAVADLAVQVDRIIERNRKVDWHTNTEVHKEIEQALDDLLYEFSTEHRIDLEFEDIDKLIEQMKTVALRRY